MTASDIVLPGTPKSNKPLRPCGKCSGMKSVEGGVQLTPKKWYCAGCWRLFNSRK